MAAGWDDSVFVLLNGLSGRSFTLDALLALVIDNPVAKAGPIVACFAYAWWTPGEPVERYRRRRILIVTLLSLFLLAPIMKAVSTDGFAPRPLVRAEQTYAYSATGEIRALPRVRYNPPSTGDAAARFEALEKGDIEENDFGSFPSDHAALFIALALGIFLAARLAGVLALLWALVFTLGARVVTGLHAPIDIVAGGAIGAGFLLLALAVSRLVPARAVEAVLRATDRWPGLTAAALTLVLFELANAMDTLERLSELGVSLLGLGA